FYAGLQDELFLDLAIYGMKQNGDRNYHKLMEDKLRELGGMKTLIAHNYYSRDEFWQTWNKPNYDAVKAITDPDNIFRDLYTKTCKAAMGVRDSRPIGYVAGWAADGPSASVRESRREASWLDTRSSPAP